MCSWVTGRDRSTAVPARPTVVMETTGREYQASRCVWGNERPGAQPDRSLAKAGNQLAGWLASPLMTFCKKSLAKFYRTAYSLDVHNSLRNCRIGKISSDLESAWKMDQDEPKFCHIWNKNFLKILIWNASLEKLKILFLFQYRQNGYHSTRLGELNANL